MTTLSLVHLIYLVLIVVFLIVMACKKSIVIPCALGIVILGAVVTQRVSGAISALYNALAWAGTEFWGIILVISIVMAMSKALSAIGADRAMVRPLTKVMGGPKITFLFLAIVMFAVSMCIWPSPAVALVGALMLPIAMSSGVPAIWAAVAMNLCGHGMALSGDFFIQGAPTITAKAAGSDVGLLMSKSVILWGVMCVVCFSVAFFMFCKSLHHSPLSQAPHATISTTPVGWKGMLMAVITPLVFLSDIVVMIVYHLQGGDATALVGGSALLLLVFCSCLHKGIDIALEDVGEYLKEGFSFGIRIFAPVIVIGGFFFLGSEGAAQAVFGGEATGILTDIGRFLAENVPLNKVSAAITQSVVAVITGLDGSGFSGLPLIGATAATFSNAIVLDKEILAALGQTITIWVGGGTLIPWAVVPVAAICNVSPVELVRKNFIPVICGLIAVLFTAICLL